MSNNPGLSYCGEDIKKNDYDRYLTCLFAKDAVRENLFGLYAFNQEIAKTAEIVSEPLTGMIRLQWWREAIEGIFEGNPRKHLVVEALAKAVKDHGLKRDKLDAFIDAREFDLEDVVPQNLDALEEYVSRTSSALLSLAADITFGQSDVGEVGREALEQACQSMGLAWGILGIIRATPFYAAKKRVYLPQDLITQYGLNTSTLFELKSSPELCAVTKELTGQAKVHLNKARGFSGKIPKLAKSPLLLGILADQYIKKLEANNYNPFDPALHHPKASATWKLMWANIWGRY
ncbi:phytoene/squalene synthase family protein [Kiloniella sp. EL199]|uniref:phytoene/squalene synthase family protein n=1 Tax=Kiloniella sp. EL199 TaxID=2107581 RepID=UPI000EA247B8|nr:phytoene/squalene synthase family protein [Kiloniella sp. EL199]